MCMVIVIISNESRRAFESGLGELKVVESGFATFAQANARIAELGGEFYATYRGGRPVYNRVDGRQ